MKGEMQTAKLLRIRGKPPTFSKEWTFSGGELLDFGDVVERGRGAGSVESVCLFGEAGVMIRVCFA